MLFFVSIVSLRPATTTVIHTSGNPVHLVLDEVVYQRHQSPKEGPSKYLSVLDSFRVVGAKCKTTKRPRKGSHQIRNHENIMPAMVICRGHVGPASTAQSTKNTDTRNNLRE